MEQIKFDGKRYLSRVINVQGFGSITVATETLEHKLIVNDEYVSDDAKELDETICFYVPESKITWPEDDLREYLEIQLDERTIANEFSQERAKQITDKLVAEMIKGDLINEGDVDIDAAACDSKETWYEKIKWYFGTCEDAAKSTAMTKQDYYDWLTDKIGLRLVEIDLLETKGVINVPDLDAE